MLIKKKDLDGILEGSITLVFRRWERPTIKAGGTLRTRIGVLAIEKLEAVTKAEITTEQAQKAGCRSKEELFAHLDSRKTGDIYRIRLHYVGEDPRKALRQDNNLSESELADLAMRLQKFDKLCRQGPWTKKTLDLIASYPGKRAADLAAMMKRQKPWFKTNVRKLKEFGLTESLSPGYRISPRGRLFLSYISKVNK